MPNHSSEGFRTPPKHSEEFGNTPHDSERFRVMRNDSELRENHTLTVREVARMFEVAGVARTERSVTNWCQPNKTGIARLDAYFDQNERKYFITPESVNVAIQEELARAQNAKGQAAPAATNDTSRASGREEAKTLQQEIIDLKIASRVKDQIIDMLRSESEKFGDERQRYIDELMRSSRQIGELETKLRLIEAPKGDQIG